MAAIADEEFASRQDDSAGSTEMLPPKSAEQYRLERLSWFGLVGVLIVTGILSDWLSLHNGVTPLAAGFVLLAAAFFELRRAGSKSISRWLAGIFLLLTSGFNLFTRADLDLSLLVVLVAIVIIGRSALNVTANKFRQAQ